ncbi:MAG: hypothetical protein K940chlam6_00819 [Chlamydiae bacterium]|nr:hypothetical protein [Chlamydiota bacterium]NGX47228.1 hypothetical protein [Chlamydiota bacterium]
MLAHQRAFVIKLFFCLVQRLEIVQSKQVLEDETLQIINAGTKKAFATFPLSKEIKQ